MTIRPIVRFPDRRLAMPARPVTAFDDGLRELAADLLDTMRAAPGIGITAPHIGVPLRVVVLELDAKAGPQTYVNPEITWASPEMIMHRKAASRCPAPPTRCSVTPACASATTISTVTCRPRSEALRAVCHQHEIDQLDGMFWIQRLSRLKRERLVKKFEKMSRGEAADMSIRRFAALKPPLAVRY